MINSPSLLALPSVAVCVLRFCQPKEYRRIAGDNPGLSTGPGLSLMTSARGLLPPRPVIGCDTGALAA